MHVLQISSKSEWFIKKMEELVHDQVAHEENAEMRLFEASNENVLVVLND